MPFRMSLVRNRPRWPIDQWDEVRAVPGIMTFGGAADPSVTTYQPGGAGPTHRVYVFATNDEVFIPMQIPHNYKQGTNLKPHIHWTPRNRGVAEGVATVAWALDYSVANQETGVFAPSSTLSLEDANIGVDHAHLLTPSKTIPGAGLKVSAIILCRIYRAAGDTWAGAGVANLPCFLEFDIHYLIDSLGSDIEVTKRY